MKLGYSSATAGIYDIDEAFRFAEELKLDFIELTYDYCDFLPESQTPKRVNELRAATGIDVSVHLPFIDLNIASLITAVRQATITQTLKALDYAQKVQALCSVLHTGHMFIYQPVPKQAALDALHDSLSQLSGVSVPIALENLGLYGDGLVRGANMLKDLTDSFGMYNCLDFGHALIEKSRNWSGTLEAHDDMIKRYFQVLGKRIIHLHLCNNNAQDDLHTATSQGVIDYQNYQSFLTSFQGTICLEIAGGREEVRKSTEHIRSLEAVLV
jgi:sugar phosphate isomerase/epimerase